MPGVKDWLKKASNDLTASKKLSDNEETFDCSVFHTHQCVEKAFKAFIVFMQKPIPKTHDLRFLLVCCAEVFPDFMLLREESQQLNSYGHDSRYPNDSFYVDKNATDEAIAMAEKILVAIKRNLAKR